MANLKLEVVGWSESRDVVLVGDDLTPLAHSERASLNLRLPTGETIEVVLAPEDFNLVHPSLVKAAQE